MEWAQLLRPDVLAILMAFAIPMTVIIGTFWHKIVKTRSETELKRSMVEQGMSPADIERVLAAGPPKKR